MMFVLRGLSVVIGIAFVLAAVNLYLNGVGQPQSPAAPAPVQLTLAPSETPAPITLPRSVVPGPAVDSAEIEAAWRAWMAENGLTEGALTVLQADGTAHRVALGRATDDLVPVASLSKAITGLCLDDILQEQGLSWYTRLGDIRDQMSAVRLTPQEWNDHITLASLVTHTSGLRPDITQGTMGADTHGALGLHHRIAFEALREDAMETARRGYFYNNVNYAILGVVIEALSGESYAAACSARVLAPAGVTQAVIQGSMGSRSSFGGWELSADGYARLAQHWFTAGREAIDRPFERPMHDGYSLGYHITGDGSAAQVSHSGLFCHPDGDDHGAWFNARGDGVVISANWAGCVSASESDGLGQQLAPLMR